MAEEELLDAGQAEHGPYERPRARGDGAFSDPRFALQLYGGTVRAKRARMLAIPLTAAPTPPGRRAKGSPAAERWLVEAQERFTLFARAFERKYGSALPTAKKGNLQEPQSAPRSPGESGTPKVPNVSTPK